MLWPRHSAKPSFRGASPERTAEGRRPRVLLRLDSGIRRRTLPPPERTFSLAVNHDDTWLASRLCLSAAAVLSGMPADRGFLLQIL